MESYVASPLIQRYNQTEAELGPALFYERYGDTPLGNKILPTTPSSDEKSPKKGMYTLLLVLKDKYPNFEVGLKCILRVFPYFCVLI